MLSEDERSDYGTLVGLWLNLDRIHYQRSVEMLRALNAASNDDQLSRNWFDAAASHEEEVDEFAYRTNVARLKAGLLAQYSGGRWTP